MGVLGVRRGARDPTLDPDSGSDRCADGPNAQSPEQTHRSPPRHPSHYVAHHFLRIPVDQSGGRDPGSESRPLEVSVLSVLRTKVPRDTLLLYQLSTQEGAALPGGAEGPQQPAIKAPEPGDFPGQHQEDGESEENWVARRGPGQHEAKVHDCAEEG